MTPSLEIRKQYGPSETAQPRVEWSIREGEQFVAYARTYTGAQRAAAEITASLARFESRCQMSDVRCLTQAAIDGIASANSAWCPMGALRRVFWNAARRMEAGG